MTEKGGEVIIVDPSTKDSSAADENSGCRLHTLFAWLLCPHQL